MTEALEAVSEFDALTDFLVDTDLDNALDNVVKLISRITQGEPIEPGKAARLVALMSAYATKAGFQATYYKTVGKAEKDSRLKMDIYKSASYHLDKLVDSIKYLAK